MEEKNKKTSLTVEEIKEIAPNWTEGWTEEKIKENTSNLSVEDIKDIEFNLPELLHWVKINIMVQILGIVFAIAVIVLVLCILSGIFSINTSSQIAPFAISPLFVSLLMMSMGFGMINGSDQFSEQFHEQFERKVKGFEVLLAGDIIGFIGMLLMVM